VLADLLLGQGDGGELAQAIDLGQAERVVLVGLAFEMFELPGLAGGVGDEAGDAELRAEVADPAGEEAGLDEDDGGLVAFEEAAEVGVGGGDGGEAVVGGGALKAGDGLVFAEVEGENGVGGGSACRGRHLASSCGARGRWVVW